MDIVTQCLGPFGREEFGGATDAGDPDQVTTGIEEGPARPATGRHAGILETADRETTAALAKPSGAGGGDVAVALFSDPDAETAFTAATAAAGFPVIPVNVVDGASTVPVEATNG